MEQTHTSNSTAQITSRSAQSKNAINVKFLLPSLDILTHEGQAWLLSKAILKITKTAVFVFRWIDGIDESQETDIHYRYITKHLRS